MCVIELTDFSEIVAMDSYNSDFDLVPSTPEDVKTSKKNIYIGMKLNKSDYVCDSECLQGQTSTSLLMFNSRSFCVDCSFAYQSN